MRRRLPVCRIPGHGLGPGALAVGCPSRIRDRGIRPRRNGDAHVHRARIASDAPAAIRSAGRSSCHPRRVLAGGTFRAVCALQMRRFRQGSERFGIVMVSRIQGVRTAERNAKKAELQATDVELAELYDKNNSFNNETKELSDQIRLYWAKPIAFLNADIRFQYHKRQELYNQKSEKISRHKAVLDELKHMASIHSSDEYKWDRLQDEQRSLSSDIDTIKCEIASIDADLSKTRSEIKYWYDLRSFVYDLCKKYDSHLKSDKGNDISDEERVIRTRLSELSCIRKTGAIEAESLCEKKKAEIKAKYDKKVELTDSMIESYESELQKNSSELKRLQAKLAESTQILELTKKQDNRNLIAKFFSDTPETQRARTVVQIDLEKTSTKKAEINKLTLQIKELKARRDEETNEYIQSCNKCAPIYLRPTKEERAEEQRLQFRLDEIVEKNKEGSDESKD